MINVKLNDILNAVPVFQELTNKNFKGSVSFKIAKLIRELNKELETFDEIREKLFNKYAEKDENGSPIVTSGSIKISEGYIDVYNKEISDTLNTYCEINADKIPASCLDDIDITPNQGLAIINFVE